MTRTIRTLGLVAAAGGAAWLIKFLVIAATDGAETGAADTATAVLYLTGVALMCAGAACLTLRAAAGRGRVAATAAIVAAPVLAVAVFTVIDALVKPLVGEAGPIWLGDEIGIAATGLFWLALGLLARREPASRPGRVASQPAG